MPRRPATSTAYPPLFVLRAGDWCLSCGQGSNAYALLASGLHDGLEDGSLAGPFLLKHVERLPKRILALLTPRCPGWRFDREDPSEPPYLMNHCRDCGAQLTDFHLHGEPGSAFYPTTPDECWNISVFALPAEEDISLVCSFSAGGLTVWLALDQAEEWESLLPAAAD